MEEWSSVFEVCSTQAMLAKLVVVAVAVVTRFSSTLELHVGGGRVTK